MKKILLFMIIIIAFSCSKKAPNETANNNNNAIDNTFDPNAGNQNYNPSQNNPSNNGGNQTSIPSSCGNNRIDVGEQCDTVDFNQQTCETLGYAKGKLGCGINCQFDTSQCTACGNSKIDTDKGEECDASLIPENKTCKTLGFGGGIITCTDSCLINTTQCYSAIAQNFALSFDGVSDVLWTETFEKEGYDFSQGFSFEAWILPALSPDCDNNDNWRFILTTDQAENFSIQYLDNMSLLSTIQTRTEKEDGTIVLNDTPLKGKSNTSFSPKKWSHIAMSYDPKTGIMAHYQNGKITAVAFGPAEKPILVHQLIIGGDSDNVSFCPNQKGNFRGIIDEVRIWNKTLSAGEISSRRYQRLSENENGLIAYYHFDEIYESPGFDASQKQNHALVFGNPQRVVATWNSCGDNIINSHESCDPTIPSTETCVSQGFLSGSLACNGICDLDVSSCQKQDQDLVAWFSFDNDITDAKKITDDSAHNLTAERKPDTLVRGRYGFGQSIQTQEQVISIASTNELKTLTEFTLSSWIKADSLKDAAIISKGDNTANHLDYALALKSNGKISLQLDAQAGQNGTLIESSDNITVNSDVWNHIAVTFKQSQDEPADNNILFYINGISAGAGKFKGPFNGSDAALILGGNEFNQKNFFNGIIDDIKIFKKVRDNKQICLSAGGTFDENSEAKCHAGNYALSFDGTNDRIIVQNSKSLAFETQFTLSVRLRTSQNINSAMKIFEQNQSTLSINANGKAEVILHTIDPQNPEDSGVSSAQIISTSIINDNRWHNISVTFNGETIFFYIDGVLENMAFHHGTLGNGQTNRMISIGSSQDGNSQSFKGKIDSLVIYNNTMSDSDIFLLSQQGMPPSPDKIALWYELNDGFGSIAKDNSANKNDGVLGETNIADEKDPQWIIVTGH